MKICLVFTPFQRPNSLPFGISYLKSYLEKNIPNLRVKNLDLNVEFFDKIIKKGPIGLCKHCFSSDPKCASWEALAISGEIQRIRARLKQMPLTKKGFDIYANDISVFENFFKNTLKCYSLILRRFIEQDDLPDILSEILHEDLNKILTEKPDFIGFSILVYDNLLYALALAKIIKLKTDIPVIFGGAMMAHLDAKELLGAFNFIDYIFQGESEIALEKFIKFFHLKKFDSIPNLAYREGRQIRINEKEYIKDLDSLPFPDFSDFNLKNYIGAQRILPIISSRGCYWKKCAFCTHTLPYSGRILFRKVKNVVDELESQMAKFKTKYFLFVDESIPPDRINEISAEILKRNIQVYYGAEGIRPENNLSYELLRKAYTSGLRWIYLGVESVTQRLLDKMHKGTKVENIKRIIQDCRQVGIVPFISCIIGFPSQTKKELKKECIFLREHLPYDTIGWGAFELLKGSLVFNRPKQYSVIIRSQKILFKIKNKVVHQPVFDFITKKGLSTDMAMEIVNREVSGKREKLHVTFDEITDVFFSATKFRMSQINVIVNHFENHLSSALKTLKINKVKIAKDDYYHFLLGVAYEKLGKFKQALAKFKEIEKMILEKKFKARVHLHLAECYERTKRYRKAIHSYEEAVKIFPKQAAIYLGLGKALLHLKKYKKAIITINKAVELTGKRSNAHFLLSSSYEKIGQYKKAIEQMRKEEKINPENSQINFLLGKYYKKLGQIEKSNRELNLGFLKLKNSRSAYA